MTEQSSDKSPRIVSRAEDPDLVRLLNEIERSRMGPALLLEHLSGRLELLGPGKSLCPRLDA